MSPLQLSGVQPSVLEATLSLFRMLHNRGGRPSVARLHVVGIEIQEAMRGFTHLRQ